MEKVTARVLLLRFEASSLAATPSVVRMSTEQMPIGRQRIGIGFRDAAFALVFSPTWVSELARFPQS
jgi:hypothetical protein